MIRTVDSLLRCVQNIENVEIKTHFDEKWNYEHRLALIEGCLTRKKKKKRTAFLSYEVNPSTSHGVLFN